MEIIFNQSPKRDCIFFTSFMNLLYFPKEIVLVIMELFTDFNCNIFNAMLTCKDFNSTIKLAIRKIENVSRLKDEQLCEFINITSLDLRYNKR